MGLLYKFGLLPHDPTRIVDHHQTYGLVTNDQGCSHTHGPHWGAPAWRPCSTLTAYRCACRHRARARILCPAAREVSYIFVGNYGATRNQPRAQSAHASSDSSFARTPKKGSKSRGPCGKPRHWSKNCSASGAASLTMRLIRAYSWQVRKKRCNATPQYKTRYRWLHGGYTATKQKRFAAKLIATNLYVYWCRREESNTRPSHYE